MLNRVKLWMKSKIKPIEVPIYKTVEKNTLLYNKVSLIIGGDGGIGFEIAKKFINSGCKVIIGGTNENKLKKCINELKGDSKYIVIDLYNVKELNEKINNAVKIFGHIDILVNCSGRHIQRPNLDFLSTTEDEYNKIMDLNLKGNYFVSQYFAKYLINAKINGHILFISSQSALEPSWSPYRLSKRGIEGITEGLGQQLLKYNIIVNGIGPGPTATQMQNYNEGSTIYTDDNPIKRYTMPEEVAEYALMLCSNLGNTIVGQTIYMSGGRGIIEKR